MKLERLFFISGIGLIALSGILFTVERFIAVFYYASDSFPVKLNGTGSYQSEPIMPGIFDNLFVGLLLVLGIILLVFGMVNMLKTKK